MDNHKTISGNTILHNTIQYNNIQYLQYNTMRHNNIQYSTIPHPFVFYAPWTGGSSLSLGLGQPWPCLDPFPLLPLLFGIAFHLQLVLPSYHPIFLRPYHFLKLVSFLGANRTTSASVCLWLLRGAI